MPHILPLPIRLDVDAACDLWAKVARTEDDLLFDAATLSHLGAAGLQVLLMAQRRHAGQKHQTVLINAAPDCMKKLAQMGAGEHIAARPSAEAGDIA